MERIVLHIDMDAFFASVEQRDHEEYRGKPVIVGGLGPRGVVSTASYEARKFGVHSAQAMAIARRLCPNAIFLHPDHTRYSDVSRQIFSILSRFSPVIEQLSIDEGFLDLTGMERLMDNPRVYGEEIKRAVREETGLTASVGIAPNKFLAKLASDLEKPDGLVVIRPEDAEKVLAPLPVNRIFGVGKKLRTMFAVSVVNREYGSKMQNAVSAAASAVTTVIAAEVAILCCISACVAASKASVRV